MLKKILIGLTVILVVLVVVIAMQPAEYSVQRTAVINAPPATVYEHVADFHKWDAWSPWAKLDPAAKNSFEGPVSGKGAIFAWDGNDDVGAGRMEITDAKAAESLAIKLSFLRPFESSADVGFAFKPDGAGTSVTWSMTGGNNFVGKAFCLFMDMDKMIGADYEKGLASLKVAAEGGAK